MSLPKFIPGNSLRSKIVLGYALLFLLVSIFIYTYFPFKYKQQAISAIEFKINGIIDLMAIGVGIGMGELDLVAIQEGLSWAKKDSSITYIIVLSKENEPISTYQESSQEPLRVDRASIKELLQYSNGAEHNSIVRYQKPLIYQQKVLGKILIGYSLQNLHADIARQKATTLYVCLAIFAFGLFLSFLISTTITHNIIKFSKAIDNVAEGETIAHVSILSRDEIGKLAHAFNNMTTKVNNYSEELRASKQYADNIITSMLDSLLVLDQNNDIVRANRASCQLLEYSETELIGINMAQLFKKTGFNESIFAALQETGFVQSQECIYLTQSGSPINVLFSAATLKDGQGLFQGTVCVAQDIRERIKSEAKLKEYFGKLEKSNRELEKFNYVVSHDLKGPLRALYKLSEWIEEDTDSFLSPESLKNFQLLKGRVSRMEALINGLLAYSHTGRLIKLPELVSVEQLVKEVIQQLAPPEQCTIYIQPNLPSFTTQRKRLYNVFMQLISNAIYFNDKERSHIQIAATEHDSYYEFSVQDNGPGIDQAYYEKIFAIFQTLEARDKVESTGIGLTIAKKITEEQNGKIWLTSVVGKGSVFYFTWPKEV